VVGPQWADFDRSVKTGLAGLLAETAESSPMICCAVTRLYLLAISARRPNAEAVIHVEAAALNCDAPSND
jgi:hypothetical protein